MARSCRSDCRATCPEVSVATSLDTILISRRRVEDQSRHLCLFFFDMLHLNGSSLLRTPLHRRRQLLEESVSVIPGFVSSLPFEGA